MGKLGMGKLGMGKLGVWKLGVGKLGEVKSELRGKGCGVYRVCVEVATGKRRQLIKATFWAQNKHS